MAPGFSLHLELNSETATKALATRIAPRLHPGDVLLLSGAIGTGKSVFARAAIRARLTAANRTGDIPSPTYTLVQSYDDGKAGIWHGDLYRLSDSSGLYELGLEQAFDEAICLIEWPGVLGTMIPADALWLEFCALSDRRRTLTIRSDTAGWQARLGLFGRALTG